MRDMILDVSYKERKHFTEEGGRWEKYFSRQERRRREQELQGMRRNALQNPCIVLKFIYSEVMPE